MPEIAEPIAPVVAPSKPVNLAPSSPAVINVTPASIEAASAPKPGSAREKMFNELRRRAKSAEEPAEAVAPSKNSVTTNNAEEGDPVSGVSDEQTPSSAVVAEAKAKKVSPWKLVDEWKKRAADAESKMAEVTKNVPTEEQRKAHVEEFRRREERLSELENEIRFTNFQKSQEFQEQYQKPYEQAWGRAMNELKEITITDSATGESREVSPADLLELVNLPLGKAQDLADENFGKFSSAVMNHRKEIKTLWESQAAALENAKQHGAERDKQRMEMVNRSMGETQRIVHEAWTKFNEASAKDEKFGKYFTPKEGDQDGNERLQKGFELVDRAFSENPFAPNLKPEERAAVVKRHAVVRNRAAAFGRLVLQLSKADSRIAELSKELEQFKTSAPPSTGGSIPDSEGSASSAKDSVFNALRKIAK